MPPSAGGREKGSSEPRIKDVVALLHHSGGKTFALRVVPQQRPKEQVEFE